MIEETLRRTNRNIEDRRNLWTTHVVLADVLGGPDELNLGDSRSALAHYRAGAALAEEMASADRHDMRARRDLGVSYRRLGQMLFGANPSEALNYYVKLLEIAEDLHAMDPANVDFRRDVVESNLGLGILSRKSGRNSDAIEKLGRALELQKSTEAAAPYRVWITRYITQIYTEIGNALAVSGDTTGALNSYREALGAADRLLQRAPTSLHLERDRAEVLEAIGGHYLKISAQSDLPEGRRAQLKADARSWFQKSLAIWQSWTKRKVGSPYAGRRQNQAAALIASIAQP